MNESVKIFPVLPKPSQKPIERDWPQGSLCSLPESQCSDVFMDPAQNLIAIAYFVTQSPDDFDDWFFIELGALDRDGVHPKAAGRTLYLSELPGREGSRFMTEGVKLEGMGRHIALRRTLTCDAPGVPLPEEIWSLHIWDWQESTTSNVSLGHKSLKKSTADARFRVSSLTRRWYKTLTNQWIFVFSETIDC